MHIKSKYLTLTAIILLLVATNVSAAPFRSTVNAITTTNVTTIPVASTNTTYTKSIDVKYIRNDQDTGILYKATSSGTVDLNLQMQTSYKPSTDGAVDSDYLDSHSIDTSITDTIWRLATLDTVILTNLRFKITGQGSNDASTTIEIKVSK